ncbi:2-dehydro-3-deoxygluconate kinase [Psychromonas sp. CNPT3]|uniref:sugar kinase n=1 Tax=Psychromonas sp. CNPT3 TaxID=314282 RepID=UPI00006E70C4|nr:sugar kinase [Psychromonas sp. CNPT3]AGH80058.1 2-dehydro-3-deoxygluconate kinase [Psychromonas sp. CNPT3]
MKISRIAVIGECMLELKTVNNVLEQGFGGDSLNTAIYLSRLTHEHAITTSYVTGMGLDPFSEDMIKAWQDENINTDMVFLSKDKLPGIYAIKTDAQGERHFYYWRNDAAAKFWLKTQKISTLVDDLSQHQMIYLSGVSLAILSDECRAILLEVLGLCHKKGVRIVFDNNYRAALWESPKVAQDYYKKILAITSIAFLTYDDDVLLWGDKKEEECIMRTQALGVSEIVLKRGAEACIIVCAQQRYEVSANKISNIVDTTAAGDSFSAAYLAKRVLGGDCVASAKAGHCVAGTVIQHHGAIIAAQVMPTI